MQLSLEHPMYEGGRGDDHYRTKSVLTRTGRTRALEEERRGKDPLREGGRESVDVK